MFLPPRPATDNNNKKPFHHAIPFWNRWEVRAQARARERETHSVIHKCSPPHTIKPTNRWTTSGDRSLFFSFVSVVQTLTLYVFFCSNHRHVDPEEFSVSYSLPSEWCLLDFILKLSFFYFSLHLRRVFILWFDFDFFLFWMWFGYKYKLIMSTRFVAATVFENFVKSNCICSNRL